MIGRDEVFRRTIQVLARRSKNNPVLIGEPGSARPRLSKSCPAHRTRARPEGLKDKRVLSLDSAPLSQARNIAARLEERLKASLAGNLRAAGKSSSLSTSFICLSAGKTEGARTPQFAQTRPRRAASLRGRDDARRIPQILSKGRRARLRFHPFWSVSLRSKTHSILRGLKEK